MLIDFIEQDLKHESPIRVSRHSLSNAIAWMADLSNKDSPRRLTERGIQARLAPSDAFSISEPRSMSVLLILILLPFSTDLPRDAS
jgi:hypothetical protein